MIEAKIKEDIRIYGYCLMTNHVHLVIAPGENVAGVSRFMRILSGRQTRYVNKLENRTGTLWEGRFKASLIDSETYLLACCRYVDLNPIRAAMVASPEDYHWSSYRYRIGLVSSDWLDDHPLFQSLAATDEERRVAYQDFVSSGIGDDELATIRAALNRNQLSGNQTFNDAIEKRTGRRISSKAPGRPRLHRK